MNREKRLHSSIYLISMIIGISNPISATQIAVSTNGTLPQTFSQPVLSATFDTLSRSFFVGLNTGANNFSLSRVDPTNTGQPPIFQPLANNNSITTNAAIPFLTLTRNPGVVNPLLVGAVGTSSSFIATLDDTVFVASSNGAAFATDGSNVRQSAVLLDAAGNSSAGIVSVSLSPIAAERDFIFAAVAPQSGTFGSTNSGIAVVYININTFVYPNSVNGLTQTAANVGDPAIKAKTLDPSTPEIFITAAPEFINDTAALYWSEHLQRLYIGLELATPATAGEGIRSVVVSQVTCPGQLIFAPIAPDSAFDTTTTKIVGVISSGTTENLSAINLRVMHATTGPSYLIVNGGNDTAANTNALLFALPLVDNPSSPTTHGTLANVNSPLVNNVFVTPAAAPADLVNSTDPAAMIGNGPLTSAAAISDMMVIDDTVYVSLSAPQAPAQETGIFFSQALFDASGKIVSWTPWARAFPCNCNSATFTTGRVSFFAVDAVSSEIWAVDTGSNQTIVTTQWSENNGPTSLTTTLNQVLSAGSGSALDLDAFTRGFNGNTAQRYALFGGLNTVVFTLTGTGMSTSSTSPIVITTDFSTPQNFLVTTLPNDPGCVTSLAYTQFDAPNLANNSFFAGTGTGLYEFGPVDPSTFSTLDLTPFDNVSWNLRTDIVGSITAIAASGNGTYVVTSTTSSEVPFNSRLYLIPPGGAAQIIAQTGIAPFATVSRFSGVAYISTNSAGTTEQLALTTNQGLFTSTRAGGIQQSSTTQTNAGWQLTDPAAYSSIAAPEAPAPITTVWPISILDKSGFKTFDNSGLNQLSSNQDAGPFSFVPENFNGSLSTPNLQTVPRTIYFWSDGGRRVFIVRRPSTGTASNALLSMPYRDEPWGITNPEQQILATAGLSTTGIFTWITLLQTSGILMAGTSTGVISLE